MTGTEMITDFSIGGKTRRQLLTAVNAHLKRMGIEAEDRDFGVNEDTDIDRRSYRWLVAFAIEGSSEGYYIHIGSIAGNSLGDHAKYVDFGHAKTYSASQAYQIATEAQRFLTAAAWN